ncbi:hypothetical protein [Candidatus Binatus sp.]|uniref:hypothetical protein n=1 Tax=Candidatus Binatus sp. TaxID=2811406 RepID=UPI00272D2815|nr:hypothetical protein [Candidatus Binatus sp.]
MAYYGAIKRAFEGDVDYAQIHKVFASELNTGRGRYSPPVMVECGREELIGSPDPDHISTSYVERQNLTIRMQNRRFKRLTNAFSKKLTNLKASVALHFAHYNLCRIHKTLRMTPAMAANISDQHLDDRGIDRAGVKLGHYPAVTPRLPSGGRVE